MKPLTPQDVPEPASEAPKPKSAPQKKGTKPLTPQDMPQPVRKMAKGGVARADGCARRGRTKGRMV